MIFSYEISNLYFISDFILSFFMWVLVLRFFLNIFFTDETELKFIKIFFDITNKLNAILKKIIPEFLPYQLTSLYIAWIFFMIRFYFLPIFLGYENVGHFSLIVEKNIFAIFEKKLFF